MRRACQREDPEADPDAGRGDRRSPAVPVLAAGRVQVLRLASQAVSRPVWQEALLPVLRAALQEPLQQEVFPVPVVCRALAGAHLQDASA